MRVIEALEESDSNPSPELIAGHTQHHRGLLTVSVRRKGRTAFATLMMEGKDGQPKHGEAPTDAPEILARKVHELAISHARTHGDGTYEAELRFSAGERGPAPKAQIFPFAVGAGLGAPVSHEAIVDGAMRLADFALRRLDETYQRVSTIIASQASVMASVATAQGDLMERERRIAKDNRELEIMRMEGQASRDRIALARETLQPGLDLLKRSLGIAPQSGAAASSGIPRLVSLARQLGSSLTQGQLELARDKLGGAAEDSLRRFATLGSESDVLDALVPLLESSEDALMAVWGVLDNTQAALVHELQTLAATAKPRGQLTSGTAAAADPAPA